MLTPEGGVADMRELGVIESYKLKRAVVSSASEAAEVSGKQAKCGEVELEFELTTPSSFCVWTTSSGRLLVKEKECECPTYAARRSARRDPFLR